MKQLTKLVLLLLAISSEPVTARDMTNTERLGSKEGVLVAHVARTGRLDGREFGWLTVRNLEDDELYSMEAWGSGMVGTDQFLAAIPVGTYEIVGFDRDDEGEVSYPVPEGVLGTFRIEDDVVHDIGTLIIPDTNGPFSEDVALVTRRANGTDMAWRGREFFGRRARKFTTLSYAWEGGDPARIALGLDAALASVRFGPATAPLGDGTWVLAGPAGGTLMITPDGQVRRSWSETTAQILSATSSEDGVLYLGGERGVVLVSERPGEWSWISIPSVMSRVVALGFDGAQLVAVARKGEELKLWRKPSPDADWLEGESYTYFADSTDAAIGGGFAFLQIEEDLIERVHLSSGREDRLDLELLDLRGDGRWVVALQMSAASGYRAALISDDAGAFRSTSGFHALSHLALGERDTAAVGRLADQPFGVYMLRGEELSPERVGDIPLWCVASTTLIQVDSVVLVCDDGRIFTGSMSDPDWELLAEDEEEPGLGG